MSELGPYDMIVLEPKRFDVARMDGTFMYQGDVVVSDGLRGALFAVQSRGELGRVPPVTLRHNKESVYATVKGVWDRCNPDRPNVIHVNALLLP